MLQLGFKSCTLASLTVFLCEREWLPSEELPPSAWFLMAVAAGSDICPSRKCTDGFGLAKECCGI